MMIRLANGSDILKVSQLWLYMVKELMPDAKPNVEWWRTHVFRFMATGDYFMYLAESGGNVAGFIDYFMFAEPATSKYHAVGQHFYVLPEYRRSGLGGLLWRKAMNKTIEQGAQVHELCCFEKEIGFWKAHGFESKRLFVRRERKCNNV